MKVVDRLAVQGIRSPKDTARKPGPRDKRKKKVTVWAPAPIPVPLQAVVDEMGWRFIGFLDDKRAKFLLPEGWTIQEQEDGEKIIIYDSLKRPRGENVEVDGGYVDLYLYPRFHVSTELRTDADGRPVIPNQYARAFIQDRVTKETLRTGEWYFKHQWDHGAEAVEHRTLSAWLDLQKPGWRNPLEYWGADAPPPTNEQTP